MKVDTMMQQDVVTATPDMSLAEARRLMRQKRIRHLPVVSGMRLVGIVSDRDLRDVAPSAATTLSKGEVAYQMDTTPVETCMTQDVATVSRDDSMVQAARILLDRKFGCLPVVENQWLVGVLTETDCLRAFLASATTLDTTRCPKEKREEAHMKVKDYMQTPPITVTPEDRVSTAVQRMQEARVRHLPVVAEENRLVGVITDRDVRQAGASDEPHIAEYELTYLLEKMTAKEIMTSQMVTVHSDTSLAEAGQLFLEHKFGCLPVVGDDNRLEGIITVTDLLRVYVEQHEAASAAS